MDVLNKLKNLFYDDFSAVENEDGGTSYTVTTDSKMEKMESE